MRRCGSILGTNMLAGASAEEGHGVSIFSPATAIADVYWATGTLGTSGWGEGQTV